jgi:CRP/FNR family nitrogen fixation transcriptional regulator
MIAHTAASQYAVRPAFRPEPAPARDRSGAERLDQALDDLVRPGVRRTYGRDEEIYGEGEPAEFVYRVLTGAVRTYRVLSDGRRQVCDFVLPGDYFGVEASPDHRATAEALGDTAVLAIRRSALAELARRDIEIAGELWMMSGRRLERSQDHILMLGRKSASERVAGFLIDFAGRVEADDDFELPMSRQDIADYLGLTIETVSRTFSQFEQTGMVKAHNSRRIRLTDRRSLEDMCE